MAQSGVHQVKFASIETASSGDTTLVSAVTGKRIVVIGYLFIADSAVDVRFKSGANNITGNLGAGANSGASYAGNSDAPAFQTNRGEALVINLGGAVQTSGHLVYEER